MNLLKFLQLMHRGYNKSLKKLLLLDPILLIDYVLQTEFLLKSTIISTSRNALSKNAINNLQSNSCKTTFAPPTVE